MIKIENGDLAELEKYIDYYPGLTNRSRRSQKTSTKIKNST